RGGTLGWKNPLTLSTLLSSLLFFLLFLFIESRIAPEPITPLRLVLNRSLAPSYFTNFFSVATSYGQVFRMSLYFQAVLGKSASSTGAWFVIGIVADLLSSLIFGVVVQATGRYYYVSCLSYVLLLGGVVTVSAGAGLFGTQGSLGIIIAGLAITALGYEGGITTSLVSLIANVDPKDQAVATAVTYFFRSLGSVLGLSIGTTLSQTTFLSALQKTLQGQDASEITNRVRESLSYLSKLDPSTREIVRAAYAKATHSTLIFTMCLAFSAVVVSVFIVERRLAR
ncbi:MFS general substrate transporter, partial [Macrolepiota fuliginosa MF-IS2]